MMHGQPNIKIQIDSFTRPSLNTWLRECL